MIGFLISMISFFEMAFTGDSSFIKDINAMGYASCIEFLFESIGVIAFIAYKIYKE